LRVEKSRFWYHVRRVAERDVPGRILAPASGSVKPRPAQYVRAGAPGSAHPGPHRGRFPRARGRRRVQFEAAAMLMLSCGVTDMRRPAILGGRFERLPGFVSDAR
jgi:hypothetical protein